MEDLSEAALGWERIDALVHRNRIAHSLTCEHCGDPDETRFWLAVLGWSAVAFLVEAYPELYGVDHG